MEEGKKIGIGHENRKKLRDENKKGIRGVFILSGRTENKNGNIMYIVETKEQC